VSLAAWPGKLFRRVAALRNFPTRLRDLPDVGFHGRAMMFAHSAPVDATDWIVNKHNRLSGKVLIEIPFISLVEIADAFQRSCDASRRALKKEFKIMGSPKRGDHLRRYAVRNLDRCLQCFDDAFKKGRGRPTGLNRNAAILAFVKATFPEEPDFDLLTTKDIDAIVQSMHRKERASAQETKAVQNESIVAYAKKLLVDRRKKADDLGPA
jgi:hypothetical protein